MSSRRDVLRGIAGGVAAAALPSSRAFALDVLTDDAVPDLRVLSGVGGNVVVLGTPEGQIVVDSGDAESSKVVVSTLRSAICWRASAADSAEIEWVRRR